MCENINISREQLEPTVTPATTWHTLRLMDLLTQAEPMILGYPEEAVIRGAATGQPGTTTWIPTWATSLDQLGGDQKTPARTMRRPWMTRRPT